MPNDGLIFLLLLVITNHAQKSLARQNDNDKTERAQQADQTRGGTHSNVEVSQQYCIEEESRDTESKILGMFYVEITTLAAGYVKKKACKNLFALKINNPS